MIDRCEACGGDGRALLFAGGELEEFPCNGCGGFGYIAPTFALQMSLKLDESFKHADKILRREFTRYKSKKHKQDKCMDARRDLATLKRERRTADQMRGGRC